MASDRTLTRRRFLGRGAGLALAAPYVLTSGALGAQGKKPASERIRVGCIGFHNMGRNHLNACLGLPTLEVAACCDVDKKILASALQTAEKRQGKVPGLGDYRRILDREDIDAVSIAAPDHWHALMAIHACQAGKDVYCEKPLALTLREGRRMVEAARRYARVVQTGTQHRSKNHTRLACELVRSGRIGKVHTIRTGIAGVNWRPPPVPNSPPPPELDYDMWLGPAPYSPYNKKHVHYLFRFYWDYSGGQMTNFGQHANDLAQWGNGTELTGPIAAEGTAEYEPHGWYEVPMRSEATLTYANGVKLICRTGGPPGAEFEGERGKILCGYSTLKADPPELAIEPPGASDVHLYRSSSQHGNWAECIKTRERPICDVEIGHRSCSVCLLANTAILVGRKIRWDPDREEIIGDDEAARLLDKPYRAPWGV